MTHLVQLTEDHYMQFLNGKKNFLLDAFDKPVRATDTIILQTGDVELAMLVTAVANEKELPGLKKGYAAVTLKAKDPSALSQGANTIPTPPAGTTAE
jgi:hypothetical protein